MALTNYVVASDLQGIFRDKDTGLPLAGGTISFFRDVSRNVPKEVYQIVQLTFGPSPSYEFVSMGSVLTLSGAGTVQNQGGDSKVIYYFPYEDGEPDFYYVSVKSSAGVEQFTRETWPNILTSSTPTPPGESGGIDNQIANPQFTNILLNENFPTVLNFVGAISSEVPIAPNWDLVVTGTGTITLQRLTVVGTDNVPTSPPYVLDIEIGGGITANVRQRFPKNSGLWSSTVNPIFLAGTYVARTEAATVNLEMYYQDGIAAPIQIMSNALNSAYNFYSGATPFQIPASTNPNAGNNGFVDIYLAFPESSHIRVTSINLFPNRDSAPLTVLPSIDSSDRNEAYQGDYYIPRLNQKREDSFLVAWDFAVAPFQFIENATLSNTLTYITDQTLAQRSNGAAVTWARNNANIPSINFSSTVQNESFYMLQYLTGAQVRDMVSNPLSVNVFAYQTGGATSSVMRVYLIRGTSGATLPAIPTSIGTINAAGEFTVTQAGWTEIPRSGLDTAKANIKILTPPNYDQILEGGYDYGFSGWELTDSGQIADTEKFAIVVSFFCPSAGTTAISVSSISCVPGDLPYRPPVKSFQHTLRECQFYWEKSYDNSTVAGTATPGGSISKEQLLEAINTGGNNYDILVSPRMFTIRFNNLKRQLPTMTLYSALSGSPDNVRVRVYREGGIINEADVILSINWTLVHQGQKEVSFYPINQSLFITNINTTSSFVPSLATLTFESFIIFHYVADARIGIV